MRIRVEEQEYKGRPVISIYNEDAGEEYKKYALVTLGVYKASGVIEAIEEIKKFVEKHGRRK